MEEQPTLIGCHLVVSSDEKRFYVDEETVRMMEDTDGVREEVDHFVPDEIYVLDTPGHILEKVLEWCHHHRFDFHNAIFNEVDAELGIPLWDKNFLLMVPEIELLGIARAAMELRITRLFDLCCKKMGCNHQGLRHLLLCLEKNGNEEIKFHFYGKKQDEGKEEDQDKDDDQDKGESGNEGDDEDEDEGEEKDEDMFEGKEEQVEEDPNDIPE